MSICITGSIRANKDDKKKEKNDPHAYVYAYD